ncbi:MAG TPA: tetratricopeptide repeat protein [Steroidobacteraceae bacterium]|nr:tetratricopeptide repeat protein [Steroidobacteraceae bacterium]
MTSEEFVDAETLVQRGMTLHHEGRLDEARYLYRQALDREPRHFDAWHWLGVIAFQTNQPKLAVEILGKALVVNPQSAAARNHHGNALLALGEFDSAIRSYEHAIMLKPDYAEAYYNRGNAFFDTNRYPAAIDSYEKAIELKGDYALAYNNRGLALFCLKHYEAAIADYDRAVAADPANAEAHAFRGNALQELQRYEAAIASYDRAIEARADYAEAHNGRGSALARLRRYEEALVSFNRAVTVNSKLADAYLNRGNVLKELRQGQRALADFDRAIALKPDFAEAYLNRGNVLKELGQYHLAIDCHDQAIALKSDLAEVHYARGTTYRTVSQCEAALADLNRALALKPDLPHLRGLRRHVMMELCDWDGFEADIAELTAGLDRGLAVAPPFAVLALSGSAPLQYRAAEIWVREECPPDPSLGLIPKLTRRDKIRVGYFSADFRIHPVSYLTAELFELHDRSRFDVTAFSFGPDTQDEMRRRVEGAADRFIDVRAHSDRDIVLLARSMDLDIAIDLGGFTTDSRSGIFAMRAAPLQVSYVGYLGTTAAPYMDYLVADATLVPAENRHYYSEKILYLPSFQANDSRRFMADKTFTREELGLPARGFVFCCFNTNYKITPDAFSAWMRILDGVPGSVLFLYAGNARVERNLRKEAHARGVDPDRLVFGSRLPMPEYLARYRTADLFLDTWPYNAGATASDALWAGLPVLTWAGEAFASRVAASLLQAIGVPELIAATPQEYEMLAVELAANAARRADIKRRLAENRRTMPLFDTRRFTQHLETGYTAIYERCQAGLSPEHIFIQ